MASYEKNKGRAENIGKLKQALNRSTFTPLRHDLINSEQFKNLSLAAKSVFFHLLGKYNRLNNGDLSAPLNRAKEEFNLSIRGLSLALNELIERNFLEVTRIGGKNQCSLYALTCFPLNDVNKSGIFLKATKEPSDKWKNTS